MGEGPMEGGYATFQRQGRVAPPRRRTIGAAFLAVGIVFTATVTVNQVSVRTEQLKLLNFKDFDVASSYFNPAPPPKQQVDIYVTPEGDMKEKRVDTSSSQSSQSEESHALKQKAPKISLDLMHEHDASSSGTHTSVSATTHALPNGNTELVINLPDAKAMPDGGPPQ